MSTPTKTAAAELLEFQDAQRNRLTVELTEALQAAFNCGVENLRTAMQETDPLTRLSFTVRVYVSGRTTIVHEECVIYSPRLPLTLMTDAVGTVAAKNGFDATIDANDISDIVFTAKRAQEARA